MALRTGMRFWENIGLDWNDIDLERRIINVRRNKVMGIVGTPKNGKAQSIDIASDLYDYLSQRKKKAGPVFHLEDGRELTHHLALNALKRSCERSGIRKSHGIRSVTPQLLSS